MEKNKSKLETVVEAVSITAPAIAGGILGFHLSKNSWAYYNLAEEMLFRTGCTFLSAALFETVYKVARDIVQVRRGSKEMIEKIYGARR